MFKYPCQFSKFFSRLFSKKWKRGKFYWWVGFMPWREWKRWNIIRGCVLNHPTSYFNFFIFFYFTFLSTFSF